MMSGYSQTAQMLHGTDDHVEVMLFAGFDGTVHIADGWTSFVVRSFIACESNCVFRFERSGNSIRVVVFDF